MAIWKKIYPACFFYRNSLDTALRSDHSRSDRALECRASWQGAPGKSQPIERQRLLDPIIPGWPDYKYLFRRRQATSNHSVLSVLDRRSLLARSQFFIGSIAVLYW
jgi:hypothetical protein